MIFGLEIRSKYMSAIMNLMGDDCPLRLAYHGILLHHLVYTKLKRGHVKHTIIGTYLHHYYLHLHRMHHLRRRYLITRDLRDVIDRRPMKESRLHHLRFIGQLLMYIFGIIPTIEQHLHFFPCVTKCHRHTETPRRLHQCCRIACNCWQPTLLIITRGPIASLTSRISHTWLLVVHWKRSRQLPYQRSHLSLLYDPLARVMTRLLQTQDATQSQGFCQPVHS